MMAITTTPFPEGLPLAQLPCISLAALIARDKHESLRLFDACCDQGFFLLDLTEDERGLNLLDDVGKAFDIGREFFAADLETKKAFKLSAGNVGYKPLGMIKFKNGQSDLTELFALGRDAIMKPQASDIPHVYQREQSQLQKTVTDVHPIAMLLLERLAEHLDVPFSAIESMHKLDSPSSTVLRFLKYPPQVQDYRNTLKQASLSGHTDSGSLTILFTTLGGLQVLPADADEDDESAWRWVRPEPGCAIINIGDPLVQWTGGILRSAFHRVLYAPGEQATKERFSFGYFLKPSDDSPMDRLRFGKVVPKTDETDAAETLPPYSLWHQNKTKKIMKGHQDGVFRGGIRRTVESIAPLTV